jgi:hypothetical protein
MNTYFKMDTTRKHPTKGLQALQIVAIAIRSLQANVGFFRST